jgi:hypothetical protein
MEGQIVALGIGIVEASSVLKQAETWKFTHMRGAHDWQRGQISPQSRP